MSSRRIAPFFAPERDRVGEFWNVGLDLPGALIVLLLGDTARLHHVAEQRIQLFRFGFRSALGRASLALRVLCAIALFQENRPLYISILYLLLSSQPARLGEGAVCVMAQMRITGLQRIFATPQPGHLGCHALHVSQGTPVELDDAPALVRTIHNDVCVCVVHRRSIAHMSFVQVNVCAEHSMSRECFVVAAPVLDDCALRVPVFIEITGR